MVAAGDDEPAQVALLPGHAVQRLDVRRHGHHGDELGVGVVQELAPGPLYRHRVHRAAVAREAPGLDQTAFGEQRHRVPIRGAVERDGELQVARVHPQGRARDGDALRVAGELELGRGRLQLLKHEVAVAQEVHLAARDPPVHAPRHLQDLIGAQVESGEHIAPPLDDIGVAGVVDHDGVEAADVERRLPGGGHGEQERARHLAVQKRPDHADRLAPVVEGGGERRPAVAQLAGDLLHLRARRDEHRHAPPLPHHPPHETIVQELERLLAHHPHGGGFRGVEGFRLEHLYRVEVPRVEAGVDGRREPDEAAVRPFAQGQTELELRRRLVNLVHDQRVARGDQPVFEPAARDPGRDDHHVPGRGLRGGLALAVHDPHPERRGEDRLRDRPDRERLAGPRRRHDPEAPCRGRQSMDIRPVLARQQGLEIEPQRQLDRLARRPRRGDHDDAARGGFGGEEGVGIWGEEVVARHSHARNIERPRDREPPSRRRLKRKREARVLAPRFATVPAALPRASGAASGPSHRTPHSGGTAAA